jgi:FtsZ-binding cell division protein ZapB
MDEEIELDEESIMEMVASILSEEDEEELEEEAEEEGDLYEEISDGLLDAIMEKLTVDMGATLSGWAGRSDDDMKHQMELEMAHRRSTDVAEELEALKKAQEELVFENKKLKENISNYQEVVNSLKENVQDVNLSNARLLYTNRTLRNTSLNERQKERIVEAISKAGSVEEAKTIHETLQSTVASTPARGPQSLSEAITRPTSIIRASRKEEPTADPFQARMRKLAGLE